MNDIPPVSAYEMRHTFVSVAKKLPAGEVKDLVGHSEDMDTFGVYGHALTGEDTETAQAVNGMFLKLLHAGKNTHFNTLLILWVCGLCRMVQEKDC